MPFATFRSRLACSSEAVHPSASLSGGVPSEPIFQAGLHQAEVQVVAITVFTLFCIGVQHSFAVDHSVLVSDRGKMFSEPVGVQLATKIGSCLHGSHVELPNLFEHDCFERLWLFWYCLLFASENGRGIHRILR